MSAGSLLLVLDFLGVFAFALNGALTAIGTARLDIVGVITLAMITALGGGIVRDILLGVTPPVTFRDWRYLAVATVGGLLAFAFSRQLLKEVSLITALDAAGLSLFAVTGAATAVTLGLGPAQAVILGVIHRRRGRNYPRHDASRNTVRPAQRTICNTRPARGNDHRRRYRYGYLRNSSRGGRGRLLLCPPDARGPLQLARTQATSTKDTVNGIVSRPTRISPSPGKLDANQKGAPGRYLAACLIHRYARQQNT